MNTLKIQPRNIERKPHVLRENGIIPGMLYGPNIQNNAVKASSNELYKALQRPGEVYEVMSKNGPVLVKFEEIQTHPVTREFIHFSLVQMPKGVENEVDIPVNIKGTPIGVKKGGVLMVLKDELTVNGVPRSIPKEVVANVSDLDIGDKLTVEDLEIGNKVETPENDDEVIAVCKTPIKEVFVETYDPLNDEGQSMPTPSEPLAL
jgi:large subunit ribosomal protein L25